MHRYTCKVQRKSSKKKVFSYHLSSCQYKRKRKKKHFPSGWNMPSGEVDVPPCDPSPNARRWEVRGRSLSPRSHLIERDMFGWASPGGALISLTWSPLKFPALTPTTHAPQPALPALPHTAHPEPPCSHAMYDLISHIHLAFLFSSLPTMLLSLMKKKTKKKILFLLSLLLGRPSPTSFSAAWAVIMPEEVLLQSLAKTITCKLVFRQLLAVQCTLLFLEPFYPPGVSFLLLFSYVLIVRMAKHEREKEKHASLSKQCTTGELWAGWRWRV